MMYTYNENDIQNNQDNSTSERQQSHDVSFMYNTGNTITKLMKLYIYRY